MPTPPKHGLAARTRVLEAHRDGRDWVLVADHNGIPLTTAPLQIEVEISTRHRGEYNPEGVERPRSCLRDSMTHD
ncbi:hypothetical protein PC113_g16294 [Phytophthora cactorum]|uniref:Uncharacterized protein n=1 Tax=Phytophthora cactorum TaxID=29920 RepID=A0A8T0YSF0_9STRA|nr:hypothetical protein PC113_g16294 [Phytophthora cactorum]